MQIKEYTIKNEKLEITLINLGASITKMVDRETGINVIVSHHDLNHYKTNPGYMNATIGRHAGRTYDVTLDNKTYEVTKNINHQYQLHGGYNGFNFKYFDAQVFDNRVVFTTNSPDLEDGFPGEVTFSITYKLVDDALHLIYEAVSDKKTLMSFTNHAYFNSSRDLSNTILDHDLMINASHYLELDDQMMPVQKATLDDSPLDFRSMKRIGSDINQSNKQLKIAGGFDHPYLINQTVDINHVATLKSPESQLILDVYSDQDVVVLYTGNVIKDTYILNNNTKGVKHHALCLETQGVPNASNIKEFIGCNVYDKNEIYKQTTIWRLHK